MPPQRRCRICNVYRSYKNMSRHVALHSRGAHGEGNCRACGKRVRDMQRHLSRCSRRLDLSKTPLDSESTELGPKAPTEIHHDGGDARDIPATANTEEVVWSGLGSSSLAQQYSHQPDTSFTDACSSSWDGVVSDISFSWPGTDRMLDLLTTDDAYSDSVFLPPGNEFSALQSSSSVQFPPQGHSTAITKAKQAYVADMLLRERDMRSQLDEVAGVWGATATRFAHELPLFRQVVDTAVGMNPLTPWEYRQAVALGQTFAEGGFIISDHEQACRLLAGNNLRVPILIPAQLDDGTPPPLLAISNYLNFIQVFGEIEVHDFLSEAVEDRGTRTPKPMDASVVTARLQDVSRPSLDCPYLPVARTNTVPRCLTGLAGFNALSSMPCTLEVLGPRSSQSMDMAGFLPFHMLSGPNAWSMPQIGPSGLDQAVRLEHGQQTWYTYPYLTHCELEAWMASGLTAPQTLAFPIHMNAGDILIQPAGTVYAPFSKEPTLLTVHPCCRSQELARHMEVACLAAWYPASTNQDIPAAFFSKISSIWKLWKEDVPVFPWGSRADKVRFSYHYKQWERKQAQYYCPCHMKSQELVS